MPRLAVTRRLNGIESDTGQRCPSAALAMATQRVLVGHARRMNTDSVATMRATVSRLGATMASMRRGHLYQHQGGGGRQEWWLKLSFDWA